MDYRQAVKSTVAYASFFCFPLFPEEIHYWLICDRPVVFSQLKDYLPSNLSLSDQKKRQALLKNSLAKTALANCLIAVLKYVPGLRFVGLTGSVAAKSSKTQDDIDLLVITAPNTLWLVRPFVLILIGLFFRRRHPAEDPARAANAFCPNLWLDTLALSIPRSSQNLYTAHEILQVQPLFDKNQTYQSFLHQNHWVKNFLANAYQARTQEQPFALVIPTKGGEVLGTPGVIHQIIPKLVFFLLAPLNYFAYLLQLLYMSSKRTSESVHFHSAFLHTTNYSGQLDSFLSHQGI